MANERVYVSHGISLGDEEITAFAWLLNVMYRAYIFDDETLLSSVRDLGLLITRLKPGNVSRGFWASAFGEKAQTYIQPYV